jgi:8-oxo-dGTP diphosphatase
MATQKTVLIARLILEEDGRSLFLAQTPKNGGKYALVGGKVDKEEFLIEGLIRECHEEIGIQLSEKQLQLVHVLHHKTPTQNRIVFYFKASSWKGEIFSREPKKFRTTVWVPSGVFPATISDVTRLVLQRIHKGKNTTMFTEKKKKNVLVKVTA